MAERAEELRQQLDEQRAEISRTVEQIENRVVPSRVLNRRKYRMRRSVMDWKDRLMGNEEPDYPSHWYAQPGAPMGPEYGQTYTPGTQYSFGEEQQGGSRLGDVRERATGTMQDVSGRAQGAMHTATDRASGAVHTASDRASGAAHAASDRASGMVQGAGDAVHQVGDRLSNAPQAVRRQTQGNPLALGLVAFGGGLLAASILPESQREKQLARQAQPMIQQAVEQGKEVAGEVVADLRDSAQQSAEELKQTATDEVQAFKEEAQGEVQQAKTDAQSAVRE